MARDKRALLDSWTLAKNFRRGDIVVRYNYRDGGAQDIVGTVTATLPGIGFVDVEFPWGNERVSAEELLRINPNSTRYLPSMYDTSYSSWDADQSRIEDGSAKGYNYARPRTASVEALASEYDQHLRDLRVAAQRCKYAGLNEVDAFEAVARTIKASDHEVRTAVSKVYSTKTALYWSAPGRQYRMNKGEIADGQPNCPRCNTNMQKTNYKKNTKLFVCPACFFCIKPSDIVGLPEHVEQSGFGVSPGAESEGDLITAAIKAASADLKVAAWDTLKKQGEAYLKSKYPKLDRKVVADILVGLVGTYVSKMNVHEDKLPQKELAEYLEGEVYWTHRQDLGEAVQQAVRNYMYDFAYPDEVRDEVFEYLEGVPEKTLIDVVADPKHREWKRLLKLQEKYDAERAERWKRSFASVTANLRLSEAHLKQAGVDVPTQIYDTVRAGTESDVIVEQFEVDFKKYGFGDAMFLLGAHAADGNFSRTAYNELADILTAVKES